jgi:hypothetical protein
MRNERAQASTRDFASRSARFSRNGDREIVGPSGIAGLRIVRWGVGAAGERIRCVREAGRR